MIHVKFFVPTLFDVGASEVGRRLNRDLSEAEVRLEGVDRDDKYPCVLALVWDDEQAERSRPEAHPEG